MQRTETIPVGNATSASVDISMAVGDLRISGGASELMEAEFIYDVELQPLIEHGVDGDRATVEIEQDSRSKLRTTRNEWDIRLSPALPIDLTAGVAAADVTLGLDSVNLHQVQVSSAAGDATISAGGDQPSLERISVETASGDVQLRLAGTYQRASQVAVQSAAGGLDLDLSGEWQRDVEVSVESVAGDVDIQVPSSVGVAVSTTSMVGSVKLDGFRRSDHGQVNAAFGSTPVTLRLRISTISGDITVRQS